MNRNDCEAVLYLHRTFRPRRRTGRGFLVGVTFLDAALLFGAFVLATSPFVLKPGIRLDLPAAAQVEGIRYNDMVLSVTRDGKIFFNDEQVPSAELPAALAAAAEARPGTVLILEADQAIPQATAISIYDAAAKAGFKKIFIATQNPAP